MILKGTNLDSLDLNDADGKSLSSSSDIRFINNRSRKSGHIITPNS